MNSSGSYAPSPRSRRVISFWQFRWTILETASRLTRVIGNLCDALMQLRIKNEIQEANTRSTDLQRLIKERKCASQVKSKSK